jgi:putative peptidoglycan lipid II flippase
MAPRLVSYRHTLLNSAGTLLSRVTGILRSQIVTSIFGVRADPFNSAFRIPNTLRRYVGEGALISSFIPVFQKAMSEGQREEASRFASNVFNLFLVGNIAITVLGMVFAPLYFPLLVSGFAADGGMAKVNEAVKLLVIMMPFTVFNSLFAIGMGVLNSEKRFGFPAFAPVLWNVAMIAFPLFFYRKLGVYSLGWGCTAGGMLMFAAVAFDLVQSGFQWSPVLDLHDPRLRQFFKLFLPTSANMIALTVKDVAGVAFLSGFVGAFVAQLNAFTIVQAPLGIIGIAIGTVMMPLLARFSTERDAKSFGRAIAEGFHMLSFLTLPVAVYLSVFPDTVTQIIYRDMIPAVLNFIPGLRHHAGLIDPHLLAMHISAVRIYGIALLPMSFIIIFERIFYSMHDAKTPLIANLLTVVSCLGLYFLVYVPSLGFNGFIIAEAVSSWLAFFYYVFLRLPKAADMGTLLGAMGGRFVAAAVCAGVSAAAVFPLHRMFYVKAASALPAFATGCGEFAVFAGIYFGLTTLFRAGLPR